VSVKLFLYRTVNYNKHIIVAKRGFTFVYFSVLVTLAVKVKALENLNYELLQRSRDKNNTNLLLLPIWRIQHTTLFSCHSTTLTHPKVSTIQCPTQCPVQLNQCWLCSWCPWQTLGTTMVLSSGRNMNSKLR